jgi:hypothetical protein
MPASFPDIPGFAPACIEHKKVLSDMSEDLGKMAKDNARIRQDLDGLKIAFEGMRESIGTSPDPAGTDKEAQDGTGIKRMLVQMSSTLKLVTDAQLELQQSLKSFENKLERRMNSGAPQGSVSEPSAVARRIGWWIIAIALGASQAWQAYDKVTYTPPPGISP